MEKDRIGTILRDRIKACGFTQEKFAEECGISISALKDYMRGIHAYDYELLERFAEKLDCSYDYLLGKSDSLHHEFHEVTEQTKLSEEAIKCITERAEKYDTEFYSKLYIWALDEMLKRSSFMFAVAGYLMALKPVERTKQETEKLLTKKMKNEVKEKMNKDVDVEEVSPLNLENIVLINLVAEIKDLKSNKSAEILDIMKDFDVYPDSNPLKMLGDLIQFL